MMRWCSPPRLEGGAEILVTGDRELLDLGHYEQVRILSPSLALTDAVCRAPSLTGAAQRLLSAVGVRGQQGRRAQRRLRRRIWAGSCTLSEGPLLKQRVLGRRPQSLLEPQAPAVLIVLEIANLSEVAAPLAQRTQGPDPLWHGSTVVLSGSVVPGPDANQMLSLALMAFTRVQASHCLRGMPVQLGEASSSRPC